MFCPVIFYILANTLSLCSHLRNDKKCQFITCIFFLLVQILTFKFQKKCKLFVLTLQNFFETQNKNKVESEADAVVKHNDELKLHRTQISRFGQMWLATCNREIL